MGSIRYIAIALLKILVVIALIFIFFTIGTMIGYGVIGGGKPTDVFDPDVWTHITDFFKE